MVPGVFPSIDNLCNCLMTSLHIVYASLSLHVMHQNPKDIATKMKKCASLDFVLCKASLGTKVSLEPYEVVEFGA